MKKKILEFTFLDAWLFESFLRFDEEPIEYLLKKFKRDKQVKVNQVGSSIIQFEVSESEVDDLFEKVKNLVTEKYEVADFDKVQKNSCFDAELSNVPKAESSKDSEDLEQKDKKPASDFDDIFEDYFGDTSEETIQQEVEIIGAKGYKDLLEEIKSIAPLIKKNNTLEVFKSQSYLFSVNEGDGLTTYLYDLANNLVKLGIFESVKNPVYEFKLPPHNKERDIFTVDPADLFRYKPIVCCIDISEWMTSLEAKEFKEFLKGVSQNAQYSIVVYRVPFVEKEVLKNISLSLNDLMFVRTVPILPFGMEELKQCASRELAKFNFQIEEDAWRIFEQRIMDEKSDGKFYGIKTVKKVVQEMIYKKQLSCAKSGKEDALIIKDDIKDLSSVYEESGKTGIEMLEELVGSEKFVEKIKEIIAQINLSKNASDLEAPCLHMRFVGNPGTGKTTVARIVGKILKENGVLRVGSFFEYSGRDFCGRYIGETAPKVAGICRDAYGSVLFIDEAYSLYRSDDDNSKDYGREALDTLIAEMENHRSDMLVIMAGYTDEMDKLMRGNAGLASRMPYTLEFPNFTREQLFEIFLSMVKKKFKYEDELLTCAKEYFLNLPKEFIESKDFANARFVRNLFERTWGKASSRVQFSDKEEIVLKKDDFVRATNEKEFVDGNKKKKREIGFY